MATEKVGIYRSYYGPVPKDDFGAPLPQEHWPKKRLHSWVVRWFGSDGQRYSRSFQTRKEADRFAQSKQTDVTDGKSDEPAEILLRDFKEEHLKLMKGQIAEKSIREDGRALTYLLGLVGNIPLRRITPQHAELYIRRRGETGVSASTINKEIRTLRRIFNVAGTRRGYLPEGQNCFKKVETRKVSQKRLRYVTVDEFRKLLGVTKNVKWRLFLTLLYTTGLRVDEARHLTWQDIDFERGILSVSAKRGVKELVPWEPKDHELRHIPIGREVLNLLAQWQAEAPERVPYLFLTEDRYATVMHQLATGLWSEVRELINNSLRDFNVIRRQAGVVKCSFHDLRRSCITNWARRLPAHVVRKLAGHSCLETTLRYYLAVEETDLDQAKDIADEVLSGKSPERAPTDQKLTNSGENVSETHSTKTGRKR